MKSSASVVLEENARSWAAYFRWFFPDGGACVRQRPKTPADAVESRVVVSAVFRKKNFPTKSSSRLARSFCAHWWKETSRIDTAFPSQAIHFNEKLTQTCRSLQLVTSIERGLAKLNETVRDINNVVLSWVFSVACVGIIFAKKILFAKTNVKMRRFVNR